MKIYKVSPIIKFSPFFSLTYVSKEDFKVGNLVPVDFNKRKVLAIVLEVYSLKDAKVEIRKSDFLTKKIEERLDKKKEEKFSKKEFEALKNFSDNFAIPVGEIIFFVWGGGEQKLGESFCFTDQEKNAKQAFFSSGHTENNKFLVYFPDDLSLKINKPQHGTGDKDETIYVKGAEIFPKIMSGGFDTLIIKDFNFDKYLNFQSPHISKLDLLFMFLDTFLPPGSAGGVKKIILETDFLGVVETNWIKENVFKNKLFNKYAVEIVEKKDKAKKYLVKTGRDNNGEEEILAKEVLEKITPPALRCGEKNFFFVLSHGFADRIFCNDCKKSYDCENCGTGYSLLNDEEGKFLYCKNCKNKKILKEDQYVICKHCGSWRIFPFGIGGQRVKEFLNRDGIVLIDESEKKLSVKKIVDNVKEFLDEKKKNNILIGSLRTLKVLQNLKAKLSKSFIISTGPMVKGKYFDSDEKLMRLIAEIENISAEVYINKREGDEISLDNYRDKNLFIKEELEIRKILNLPPFSKVVSLIFNYKNKKFVDKFLRQDLEKFKIAGEIKRGNTFIYYWFTPTPSPSEGSNFFKSLRQFGDIIVANTIIETSILGKK